MCSGFWVADFNYNRVLWYPIGSSVATNVIGVGGTGSFTSDSAGTSDVLFTGPRGIALDADTSTPGLWLSTQNRVLYFPYGSRTASKVYGQADFTTNTAKQIGGLSSPWHLAMHKDTNTLLVAGEPLAVLQQRTPRRTAPPLAHRAGCW